jgi:DNA-binding NarL/FixJ family response regulator
MDTIRVLLAEDHTVVRQGLRTLLEAEKDITVVGEAQTGREAVQLASTLRPSIVIMDIGMPLLNGMEATRQILKEGPNTKVLILSAHDDTETMEQMFNLGASGYLLKHSSAEILSKAIREILKGKTFFSPSVSKHLKRISENGNKLRMTSREVEVLQLIAEGKANKEIADVLEISIKTVEKHRQHIMEKLNIHDTAGLTRYAASAGIIFLQRTEPTTPY